MIQNRELLTLFPTLIGKVNINESTIMQSCRKLVLKQLHKEIKEKTNKTQGWFTNDDLFRKKGFLPLVNLIKEEVKIFCNQAYFVDFDDLALVSMWANVHTNKGNKHQIHSHRNSFLSGVIYLEAPEKAGDIVFINPTIRGIVADTSNQNGVLCGAWSIKPEVGMMLLFPSCLEHGTNVGDFEENQYRISIAFNFMLKRAKDFSNGKFDYKDF
jgi:uncharacterized protein (TIGR02466 family)